MPLIVLKGVNPPVRKISATKALQTLANLSLTEAKLSVDRRLRGEDVAIEVASMSAAELLAKRISDLGILAEIDSTGMSVSSPSRPARA